MTQELAVPDRSECEITPVTSIRSGVYQHFRGNRYQVIGVSRHSETLETLVVYRALYGNHLIWCRPVASFSETVETASGERPRFTRLDGADVRPSSEQLPVAPVHGWLSVPRKARAGFWRPFLLRAVGKLLAAR